MPLPPWQKIKTNFYVVFSLCFFFLKNKVKNEATKTSYASYTAEKPLTMENVECEDLNYKDMYLYDDI